MWVLLLWFAIQSALTGYIMYLAYNSPGKRMALITEGLIYTLALALAFIFIPIDIHLLMSPP